MNLIKKIQEFQRKSRWDGLKKRLNKGGGNGRIGKNLHVENPQYIQIGDNFNAGDKLKLQAWHLNSNAPVPLISIGNNVSMIDDCQISCVNKIVLGDGCLLGDNVFITDNFHGSIALCEANIPPQKRKIVSKGAITIGENVWIGRNVCIMPGVSIGNGAIIGANAVVTHNVSENTIVAGAPAKTIKILS